MGRMAALLLELDSETRSLVSTRLSTRHSIAHPLGLKAEKLHVREA